MAVGVAVGGCEGFFALLLGVERPFFGALGGEEFFAIEGSLAQLAGIC